MMRRTSLYPPIWGIDRETLTREIEPILTEADAQEYGCDVHGLDDARARREAKIWGVDWPDGGAAA